MLDDVHSKIVTLTINLSKYKYNEPFNQKFLSSYKIIRKTHVMNVCLNLNANFLEISPVRALTGLEIVNSLIVLLDKGKSFLIL